MGWRVIYIKADVKLSIKDEHLYLYKFEDEEEYKIILNDIDSLVFETLNTTVTTRFLTEIAKNNIMTLFCDEKYNPVANVLPISGYYKKYDQVKKQIDWLGTLKSQVWEQIVKNKILNQANVLKILNKDEKVINRLIKFAGDVEGYDDLNNEGLAAKMYFRELFGKDFTRGADIPTNWALNYGYTILLSKFNRSIASKGLLLEYGIKHQNIFNHYNLSCDLMEVLRPIVDFCVYQNTFKTSLFTSNERRKLINTLNYKVKFENKNQYITYGVDLFVNSVVQFLNEEKKNIIKVSLGDIHEYGD